MSGPYIVLYRDRCDEVIRAEPDESAEISLFPTIAEAQDYIRWNSHLSETRCMIIDTAELTDEVMI